LLHESTNYANVITGTELYNHTLIKKKIITEEQKILKTSQNKMKSATPTKSYRFLAYHSSILTFLNFCAIRMLD
jgi:hypothetical protein